MSSEQDKKKQVAWYDNPNLITSLIIGLIVLIIILSQSFAVNNNLSVANILSSILNHNVFYLLIGAYFIILKTKFGKKYFDFLNIFLILLYTLTTITSLLTVFQSFGLESLLCFAIDFMIIIYVIHTFLRSTRIWKSMNLGNSPFNEIKNDGYFYSVLVMSIILLAVNLISTTSLDGTFLTLMDTGFTILFIRYIYLYGAFLDSKKISVNNEGNFDEIREAVKESVDNFVSETKLYEKVEKINDKVVDMSEEVVSVAKDILDIDDKKEAQPKEKQVKVEKKPDTTGEKEQTKEKKVKVEKKNSADKEVKK